MFAGIMSGPELVVVFALILVLFGAKKIPEFAKGLGQGIREFKKASREVTDELQNSVNEPPSTSPNRNVGSTQLPSSPPPSTVPKA